MTRDGWADEQVARVDFVWVATCAVDGQEHIASSFGRVDVNASDPDSLYPDRTLLAPEHNVGFLKRSIQAFREVNFASQATGRIYARIRSGAPVFIDREALQEASTDPGTYAALRVIAPRVFEGEGRAVERPQYLQGLDSSVTRPTLGDWGREPGS